MAQYTWAFDVPSGTLKSHEISSKLYEESVADSKLFQHAVPVDGFGKKMGETVSLTRIASIAEPASSVLTEGQKISEDTYAVSQTSITVSEHGRAIPLTSIVEDLSNYDLGSSVEKELRRQMTLAMDSSTAAAFRQSLAKYTPTGVASADKTAGSAFNSANSANLGVYHMKDIYDELYDTWKAPPIDGGEDYMGIFRHESIKGLRDDPDWIEWQKYTGPLGLEKSELGKIANIRVIGTNHGSGTVAAPLGLLKYTTSPLGEGFVFGDDAVAVAMVHEPELRMKTPDDYGRSRGVAWYGIYNLGAIYTAATAGQTRIIHVGSTTL